MDSVSDQIKRVLIYRLGSLGDTVVALPCLHLVARTFPNAERRMLTNFPVSAKASTPALVLGENGLVHSYMSYPLGARNPGVLHRLSRLIREWKPDVLVYLAEPRGLGRVLRDAAFFLASGIQTIVGLPWLRDRRRHRWIAERGFYESESSRLGRCLNVLGNVRLDDAASWDLLLSAEEQKTSREFLRGWSGKDNFIACCVGTKFDVNDWGIGNWRKLLARLGECQQNLGLLMVGTREETAISNDAANGWRGPVMNLCGATNPRETGSLLESANLFLGLDSGPMHLASAVGTPCVAVFSARNAPGIWFPHGDIHRIIYHHVSCEGCALEHCARLQKRCIVSVSVDEVYSAASMALTQALTVPKAFRSNSQSRSHL